MKLFILAIPKLISALASTTLVYAGVNPELPLTINKTIIDIHTHIACQLKANDCYVNEDFKKHWKYTIYLDSFGVTKKELEEKGDELIVQKLSDLVTDSKFVSKAVVLAIDGFYDDKGVLDTKRTQMSVSNSFVLKETKKFPNLLYGASVHPLRKDALTELTKAKADGAIFIKWIPCIMGIDPASKDSRMTAFYNKLVELKLPLLSHTGDEHSFMISDDKLCDPQKLQRPLELGVKVIASHFGTLGKFEGETSLSRMKKLMAKFPELKFDISSMVNINKFNHIKYALDYPGRYYYGSDYPLIRVHLLGIPLTSPLYYAFVINSKWSKFVGSFTNDFDRDVALKLALGVPMAELERSRELISK